MRMTSRASREKTLPDEIWSWRMLIVSTMITSVFHITLLLQAT